MKLYIHDEKHQQVHGELRVHQPANLQQIVDFINEKMGNRYCKLVLATSYTQAYPDGESEITFENTGEWDTPEERVAEENRRQEQIRAWEKHYNEKTARRDSEFLHRLAQERANES